MKASKQIFNKGVLWHNKVFQESFFLKNFKNCLFQFGSSVFQNVVNIQSREKTFIPDKTLLTEKSGEGFEFSSDSPSGDIW